MLTDCPRCGARYALADEALGRKGRCKACGRKFVVLPADEGGASRSSRGRGRRALALVAVLLMMAALCAAAVLLWAKGGAPAGL